MDLHARYARDPNTDGVVERIFKEVADGRPLRQIAKDLTREGVPTPKDTTRNGWGVATLAQMIPNPAYKAKARMFVKHATYEAYGKQRGTHIRKRMRHLVDHEADQQVILP
jgi:hypothetical protein